MKKLIAFLGLVSISLTTVAALAQSVDETVSRKALASLIKHSRSAKLVGDVNPSEKLTDLLAAEVLRSSSAVSISNTCVLATLNGENILNCRLETVHEKAEQVIRYSLKVVIVNDDVAVLGLHSRTVSVVRGS